MNEQFPTTTDNIIAAVMVVPILVAMAVGLFLVYRWMTKLARQQKQLILAAATQAGLRYWSGATLSRYVDSKILGRENAYVFHGLSSENGIDMGIASYGYQKDNQMTGVVDYISVALPKSSNMYLVIDSQRNNTFGLSLELVVKRDDTFQQFVLEGDFPQNYQVFGIKGSQIETLQLLNPKAMLELVQTFTEYDIEISGTHIYLYGRGRMDSLTNVTMIQKRLDDAERVRQFMIQHLPKA